MSDIEFIDGLMAKAPNPNAPTFVKASISIKREELIAWLQARNEEWINADIKESRGGKWYVSVNAFKAKDGGQPGQTTRSKPSNDGLQADDFDSSTIPF